MRLRYNASFAFLALTIATACAHSSPQRNATAVAPVTSYVAYVANEASDVVTRVSFTPGRGLVADRRIPVGTTGRIEGPHGLALSPDGRFYYVALAHGMPNGRVAKYSTDGDSLIGRAVVGLFPETIAVTPDGQYLFVANHDLHGGDAVSGVSVVFTRTMTEVARPGTCVRPQGGRINENGSKHYSVCNVSDQLVEIDTRSFRITHRFGLASSREQLLPVSARGVVRRGSRADACEPTSVEPGRGTRDRYVYVACSGRDNVIEIDTELWRVTRRIATGASPHTVRTDPAGTILLVSLHADSAVAVIDLASGTERGRIPVAQTSPHGIAITNDGRYAFVTTEGSGAARGTVDVIDLSTARRVSSVPVGYSPGSVDILTNQ